MKILFTLLLATVFTSAFAYDEGRVSVTVAIPNAAVYIDGRLYNNTENGIDLTSVQPGNHTLQVYRNSRNGNGGSYGRNSRNAGRRNDLVYSSNFYVRPSTFVDIMINRFGKALVDERSLNDRTGGWNDDGNYGRENGGYGNDPYTNGGYGNGYAQAMREADFQDLLQRIRTQWFGKLGTARDAAEGNFFTTTQVRQLLSLFTAESDRLELAKLYYRNLVDRQNFRQLYDQFSYSAQSDLDRFVRDFRN